MRHFSSTPRALIAILAMASLSAGCGQMRTTSPSDTGATPMTGSSGSSGMSGYSGDSGARDTDQGQGATGTGTSADQSGTRNGSRMTPGATPNSSVPTSDGSR